MPSSDLERWLADYADGGTVAPHTSPPSPTPSAPSRPPATSRATRSRTRQGKTDRPWLPAFPTVENVAVVRAQLFDNGRNPGHGRSRHVIKLRAWMDNGTSLNQLKPDWERSVALIDHRQVLAWAQKELASGTLTQAQFDRYQEAHDEVEAFIAGNPSPAWAKMGHIGSPPGTHYFPGQFIVLTCTADQDMTALLVAGNGQIEFDRFYPNKRSTSPHAPKHHALYDPHGMVVRRD